MGAWDIVHHPRLVVVLAYIADTPFVVVDLVSCSVAVASDRRHHGAYLLVEPVFVRD